MTIILHITAYREWLAGAESGEYRTETLAREGFIHCSTVTQVVGVANSRFHGERDLVLLCIERERVRAPVIDEDCYETGQKFPHIYGALNRDAVVQVLPFPPDVDGNFSLPPVLAGERPSLRCEFPILEFDPSPVALLEPGTLLQPTGIAEHCVVCFFQDVIAALLEEGRLTEKKRLYSEIGSNPVYELDVNGRRLALFHPGVGAPLAGGFLEELIALGCRKFIACGGAGALDKELVLGHLVVPHSAVRDEGTSYHYLPPSREVAASPAAVAAIERVLQRDHVPYVTGKTWTTDAVYRETPAKIRLRRAEGCLTVEMEAAAFFAVAAFREVTFGQILYSGDDLSSDQWDSRHWQRETSVREKLFWLAAEACLEL
jgi:uridine phosphorylase